MRKFNIVIISLIFIILFFNINQSFAREESTAKQFSETKLGEYTYKVENEQEVTPKFEDVKKNFLSQLYNDHYEIYVKNVKKAEDLKTEMIVSSMMILPIEQFTGGVNLGRKYSSIISTDNGRMIETKDELTLLELRDIYKCSFINENGALNIDDLSKNNYRWKVYFKIECGLSYVGNEYILDVTAIDVATDPSKLTINPEDFPEPEHTEDTDFVDSVKKIDEIKNDFLKDAFATLEKGFWKVLRTICDWIQGALDILKNVDDGMEIDDFEIMYSFSRLNNEKGTSSRFRNNYTKVAEEKSEDNLEKNIDTTEDEDNWQKQIIIDNKNEKFTKEKTNIPVITVEPYNMAKGKITFFDINFFTPKKEKHSNAWNFLRDLATDFTHITLYVAIVLLLTILIIYGIRIVYNSSDLKREIDRNSNKSKTPKEVVNYKEGMKRYAFSLVLIIGVIVFMTLCIFLNDVVVDILKIGNSDDLESDEFPIRVTVENEYSFSTNPIGYFRFMAASEDISDQRMYSFIYIVLVIINCLLVVCMIARVILIYVLSVIGPVIVVFYAARLENKSPMALQSWAIRLFTISSIQIIISIFYKVVEQLAIK